MEAVKKAVAKKKKKTVTSVPLAHIMATFNNTIMTVTDPAGNTIAWASAGASGFKGPKKATPYAATLLTKTVTEKMKDFGVKDANVFVKGIGGGREASIRALHANNINVLSIRDLTPVPHNGCRRRKERHI